MSNVGKSLLAAGLCRIFKQDGYKVAPFKSQNMALNSFITKEGLEMGRAQVMQAEAAGVEPDVMMNPILLKPTNDIGSQVIVNGEVYGQMSASDYYKEKLNLVPEIMRAFNTLSEKNDIIVIEGAGSPAEINLKENDIVNMWMAKQAKAPVLLAGDIDRGGVFAQLYGTVELLPPDERELIKGIVINKFRGDVNLLKPGIDMLTDMVHIPTVGVVPYMHLDVDDEDSLSERLTNKEKGLIDIAVVKLPRISNFTDFRTLEGVDGVSVRYIDRPFDLGDPDLIMLPGSKNTMRDLKWLRESGMESLILKHAAAGKPVFGICGGFQMLGEYISDPDCTEEGGDMRGMDLLPMKTVFKESKHRTRVSGNFKEVKGILSGLSNMPFEGYEIHMGESFATENNLTTITDEVSGKSYGDGYAKDNVYGSYVHGIFDNTDAVKALIDSLASAKGLDPATIGVIDAKAHKEEQYDLLADHMRKSLDMDLIYRILNTGVE